MPLELIIVIGIFAIPILAGIVSGFTTNTMTQNYIPSMRDNDTTDQENWEFSDSIEESENLAMEVPSLSFEAPTAEKHSKEENEPTSAIKDSKSPKEVGTEVNRFFSIFNKNQMEIPTLEGQNEMNHIIDIETSSDVDVVAPQERTLSVVPEEVGIEINRFLGVFRNNDSEPALEEPHYVDQMLDQIDGKDIPPPTEEDVAAESPLTQTAFRSIEKKYGFQTASQITTTPILGARGEEDVMIGRIQFDSEETCLVYEDTYVYLRGSAIEKVASNEGIVVLVKGFFFDDGFIVQELNSLEELVMQEAM